MVFFDEGSQVVKALHNTIAHPLLGVFPGRAGVHIHDVTAGWLNLDRSGVRSLPPQLQRRRDWLLHNCVSHPLMGILPVAACFIFHDDTAEQMDVSHWV